MNLPDDQQNSAEFQFRRDADAGFEPTLVMGRAGTRMYSLAALQERCEQEFVEEYGESAPAIEAAKTPLQRVRLILEVVNYVLSVESVHLDADTKAALIERIHANLFGYGPLDSLFMDSSITTIDIHGSRHISVRHGHGDLSASGIMFDDEEHLRRVIMRILVDAGAALPEDEPFLETGLIIAGRPVSLSIAMPPLTPYVHADIRLHPETAPSLQQLADDGMMTMETAHLITQIARSEFGFVIVGESESGKTTLLNAVLQLLPGGGMHAIDRAGELRLPAEAVRRMPKWAAKEADCVTFGQQIEATLGEAPALVVLDELRIDEPLMILPLLTKTNPPRQIWSVRGVPDAKKLQSSMGMMARRANMSQSEAMVAALYERLPFVITVRNIRQKLQVFSVAEWQSRPDSDYPDYVMLMQYQDGAARPTGAQLARWLD
jgi:Flp pilus assembly CpaF family ATPase